MEEPALNTKLLSTLKEKQEALFFKEALDLYIPPEVSNFVGAEKSEDAAKMVKQWLEKRDSRCLLLLGDSGAGKTLFGQWLALNMIQAHQDDGRLPLFSPLLSQENPEKDLIDRYLKIYCGLKKFEREQIKHQPLLLILDGFDEMKSKTNLYQS